MIKKLAQSLLAIGLSMSLISAHANDLENAFNALTNYTGPGIYNSQVRGFMTGGGFDVSFAQDQMNFVSITPPSINAGCGGISAFFGGIGYVSGQQLTELLKQIAADSLGEAFKIALRTLCPTCATVLSDLQKVAQMAAELSMNQCAAAMALLDTGINAVPSLKKFIRSRAALDASNSGELGGFLMSLNNYTDNFQQAIQDRVQDLENITNPGQKQTAVNQAQIGNQTWKYLQGMTTQQKVFIMSLLGANVNTVYTSSGQANSVGTLPHPPSITPADLGHIFLFGANALMNNNITLLQCSSTQTFSGLNACFPVVNVPLASSYWYQNSTAIVGGVNLADYGFYGAIYALLQQAVANVAADKPLDTGQAITLPPSLYGANVQVQANFTTDEIEGLINLSPVPLVRAVDIAAFYPEISSQMIGNITEIVASHYTIAYIKKYILNFKQTGTASPAGNQGLNPKVLANLVATTNNMRVILTNKLTLLLTNLQMEQSWINQVNEIQATIYKQVIRSGLSANMAYSLGLTGG